MMAMPLSCLDLVTESFFTSDGTGLIGQFMASYTYPSSAGIMGKTVIFFSLLKSCSLHFQKEGCTVSNNKIG